MPRWGQLWDSGHVFTLQWCFPVVGLSLLCICSYIWWCLVVGCFFFDRVGARSVRAVAAVGSTVRCPVIDDVGYQVVAANRFSSFYLGRGVRERWCVAHPCLLVWENPPGW
jgi:hypothetical protein